MNNDIFISYSRRDLSQAKRIKTEIEKTTGVQCWMDMDGIESGVQFEDVIIDAIDNCKIVVFLLSENSMKSKWVKDEVRYAYDTHKRVVPLKIDDCELKGWFLFKFSGLDVITYVISDQKNKMMNDLKSWTKHDAEKDPTIVPIPAPPIPKPGPIPPKPRTPYFAKYVKWGIRIQTVIFALIALCCAGLLFVKGPIGANKHGMMINDVLLVLDLVAIVGCTLMIKKYKWMKWSFLVLDLIALYLLIDLSQGVYGRSIEYHIHYKSISYKLLYDLGSERAVSAVKTWMYFVPLYILHNVCVLVIMYSRTLWYKLPYKLRRMTK